MNTMSTATDVTKVEKTVYDALETFGAEPTSINREATFAEIDVDSLDLAELSQIVEEEYGVTFKSSDVEQLKTVGDAIDFVVARA
jgi:acyl carrier protein